MTYEKKYYITASNFKKLVFRSQTMITKNILDIYRDAYDKADLGSFINQKEAAKLTKSAIFLREADDHLIAMENENKARQKQRKNLDSPSKFLFVAGSPKYHVNNACETLSKDFDNFEVPDEIESRGSAETKRLREFAQENRKLLGEGREDVFLLRLQSKFKLKSRIDRVSFPNSGKVITSVDDRSKSVDDLVSMIDEVIQKLQSFAETEEGRKATKDLIYAPVNILNYQNNLSGVERSLLENKRNLINLVLQYHIQKYKGGDVTFSAELLKLYGFQPCGKCCAEEAKLDF